MRIQILPLPSAAVIDETNEPPMHRATRHETTPFVIVIDHCTDLTLDTFRSYPQLLESLRNEFGATAWIIGDLEQIDVPGALQLPPQLQQQLVDHLSTTLKEQL